MTRTDIAVRLRQIARHARLAGDTPIAREIGQLVDEIMAPKADHRAAPPPEAEIINGRRVMVQRPRAPFAV
jgi:hypothetical protein